MIGGTAFRQCSFTCPLTEVSATQSGTYTGVRRVPRRFRWAELFTMLPEGVQSESLGT